MIYFLRAINDRGPIKIGFAIEPPKRLAEIQRMSPAQLKILKAIEGDRMREAEIHRHFSYFRKYGEWFDGKKELLRFIANPDKGLPEIKIPQISEPQPAIEVETENTELACHLLYLTAVMRSASNKRISCKLVAKETGISQVVLSRIGRQSSKPSKEVIIKLSEYFCCNPEDVYSPRPKEETREYRERFLAREMEIRQAIREKFTIKD